MKTALNFWQILRSVKQNILPVLLCVGILVTAATANTSVQNGAEENVNSPTPNNFEPYATFQRMWIDYNITEGGRKGMRIHTDFKVYNMKGIEGYLALYFQYRNGTALTDKNNAYNSTDDTVAAYREISPGFQAAVYEDYSVFMPYDELDLSCGSYELRIYAAVIYKQGGLVSRLTYYNFDYNDTCVTNPTATFGRMWVDYNTTRNGRRGMLVHLNATVVDMKGQRGYLAFYFQKKDGTRLYSSNPNFRSNERSGQLALYFEITPAYERTLYDDAQVFMPYDEFNVARGNHNLQMDVDLIKSDGALIQHLSFYDFWFDKK